MKNYLKENLYVEIPLENLSNVPEAILAIPFVGTMITACMFFAIEKQVPILDKTFFKT